MGASPYRLAAEPSGDREALRVVAIVRTRTLWTAIPLAASACVLLLQPMLVPRDWQWRAWESSPTFTLPVIVGATTLAVTLALAAMLRALPRTLRPRGPLPDRLSRRVGIVAVASTALCLFEDRVNVVDFVPMDTLVAVDFSAAFVMGGCAGIGFLVATLWWRGWPRWLFLVAAHLAFAAPFTAKQALLSMRHGPDLASGTYLAAALCSSMLVLDGIWIMVRRWLGTPRTRQQSLWRSHF